MRKIPVFRTTLPLIALVLWLLSACSTKPGAGYPSKILLNGNIFTADSTNLHVSAVAIAGDRIQALGTDAEMRALAGPATEIIDLHGAFAMPGFIEGHGHFISLGNSLQNLNLMHTRSWQEIVAMSAEKAKTTAPGEWIEGRGWHQEKWNTSAGPTVNGYPFHTLLSDVSPNNPVVLYHASGHALLANAKAMELAGISAETPNPVGGRIVRSPSGTLTGVFEENAMDLIEIPFKEWKNKRPEAEKRAAFDRSVELASQECLSRGITTFEDAGSDFWEIEQYERLATGGKLPLRVWAMILQPKQQDFAKLDQFPKLGLGNGYFTCRAVKAYLDGALGSYGAWLLAPYSDKPESTGQNTTPLDTVAALAQQCEKHGLQLCVHAIGDRGNREVLNIMGMGHQNSRWRIEHSQHIDPQDILRFQQEGVIASMQAIHCTSDAPFVIKRLGEDRARTGAYAWRSLLDAGAHLANGTDTPVEDVNPLPCLYAAVTRKSPPLPPHSGGSPTTPAPSGADQTPPRMGGQGGAAFFPEQCMTRLEALLSYTIWNAYAAFEEQDKGSLQPGKYADIVVLSADLLKCPVEEIPNARVLQTIVGGKVLFMAK